MTDDTTTSGTSFPFPRSIFISYLTRRVRHSRTRAILAALASLLAIGLVNARALGMPEHLWFPAIAGVVTAAFFGILVHALKRWEWDRSWLRTFKAETEQAEEPADD